MVECFDAIVLGGGPGGATAGLLLARAGWSVAVIEKALFPRRKVCGEYISATNLPLLSGVDCPRYRSMACAGLPTKATLPSTN